MTLKLYVNALTLAVMGFLLITLPALAQEVGGGTQGDGGSVPLDQLSDFALFSMVLGALTPWITAYLSKVQWKSEYKFLMMFGFCMVSAAINAYLTRTLDFENWVRSLLLVTVAAMLTYNLTKSSIRSVQETRGIK